MIGRSGQASGGPFVTAVDGVHFLLAVFAKCYHFKSREGRGVGPRGIHSPICWGQGDKCNTALLD